MTFLLGRLVLVDTVSVVWLRFRFAMLCLLEISACLLGGDLEKLRQHGNFCRGYFSVSHARDSAHMKILDAFSFNHKHNNSTAKESTVRCELPFFLYLPRICQKLLPLPSDTLNGLVGKRVFVASPTSRRGFAFPSVLHFIFPLLIINIVFAVKYTFIYYQSTLNHQDIDQHEQ